MGNRYARRLDTEINKETPELGQQAINQSLQAGVSAAMPDFERSLQGIRESAISRGISGGNLGTTYEGDLASAFQRNISNAGASYAFQNFEGSRNRYLDLLTGQRDYQTALDNARKRRHAGLLGGLGTLATGAADLASKVSIGL